MRDQRVVRGARRRGRSSGQTQHCPATFSWITRSRFLQLSATGFGCARYVVVARFRRSRESLRAVMAFRSVGGRLAPGSAGPLLGVADHERKSAATPLIPTSGRYCVMESSTAGDSQDRTGARNPKLPVTAIRYVPRNATRNHQAQPLQCAACSGIQSREAKQNQQPRHGVEHVRCDQPSFARDDRGGGLAA